MNEWYTAWVFIVVVIIHMRQNENMVMVHL